MKTLKKRRCKIFLAYRFTFADDFFPQTLFFLSYFMQTESTAAYSVHSQIVRDLKAEYFSLKFSLDFDQLNLFLLELNCRRNCSHGKSIQRIF